MRVTFLLTILLASFFFFACSLGEEKKPEGSKTEPTQKTLIMAETSEMTAVMLQMYSYNESLRGKIMKEDKIPPIPHFFERIFQAELTEGKERHDSFDEDAAHFLKQQQALISSEQRKKDFNKMVNSCIACHSVSCTGPIPKIEKLLIP